jgi:hypothetical protein
MAKSGFVPAWMKIPSSDKTNGNQKLNLDRSQTSNRSETSSTSSSPPIITGRNKSNEQQIFNDFDGQSDGFFSFSSPHTQSRRSYSRERSSNSFAKNSELNGNGYRSINNSQRRLHSGSSYPNDSQPSNIRNGDPDDTTGFDRLEQDFPSLNGREKKDSSSNDQSSSVWNNAASKFRTSHNEPFKLLDRSLSNNSRSNRILTRKDRLLSTPNGLNGTSSSITNRSITLDLQTNCKTQTKNLDKRSDFFNSLKNDSTNEGNKHQLTKITTNSNRNYKTTKGTLLLLSVPETPEEKELLIRMGWNDCDERTYEITDKDKEEYEKRIQLLPKTDNTSAALMSALHRRALPCIDIQDLLRFEMIGSTSDDDDDNKSSDE